MNPRRDNEADHASRAEAALDETSSLVKIGNSGLVQIVLGTAPWTGGVGAFLSRLASQRQEVRLREFLNSIVRRVDGLEGSGDEVDQEFIRSDEFLAILTSVSEEAVRSADTGRLEYLRRFLSNATINRRPDATWIDLFNKYLPRLSGAHLRILEGVYVLQKGYAASDRLGAKRLRGLPASTANIEIGDFYGDILLRVGLSDLNNLGLLVDWKLTSGTGDPQAEFALSRNGLLFMRFLQSDWIGGPDVSPVD